MLERIRKVNKDTVAAIHQIITLPNNQPMGLQIHEWPWLHPSETQ